MGSPHPPHFVLEGGKFHFAEALFNSFKFKIRCPYCIGNHLKPGFIKDEAGKGGKDGQSRRMWRCQRSNSRTATGPCSRATCTEYISLARKQLDQTQFAEVLERVCQSFPPEQAEFAALQGYSNLESSLPTTTLTTSTSSLASQTLPKKRKAEEELPFLDKTARHSQTQKRQESTESDTASLQSTLQHLESMIEMSKTWQEQHRMLTIFLTSSSPPQPTPSSQTPSWSSPSLAPKRMFSSDATIPCTYPDDELSSSPPNPSSDPAQLAKVDSSCLMPDPPSKSTSPVKVYVSAAVFKRSYDPVLPTDIQSSSPIPPPPNCSSNPISRARELVQQFKQARADPATATEKRRAIRQQAKTDGVYSNFQALLNQGHHSTSTPELKCSERT
jgi:hypothetical protein